MGWGKVVNIFCAYPVMLEKMIFSDILFCIGLIDDVQDYQCGKMNRQAKF